jgi:hypothetical protein
MPAPVQEINLLLDVESFMGVGEVTGFTGWIAFVLIGLEVVTRYLLSEKLGTVKYEPSLAIAN